MSTAQSTWKPWSRPFRSKTFSPMTFETDLELDHLQSVPTRAYQQLPQRETWVDLGLAMGYPKPRVCSVSVPG